MRRGHLLLYTFVAPGVFRRDREESAGRRTAGVSVQGGGWGETSGAELTGISDEGDCGVA